MKKFSVIALLAFAFDVLAVVKQLPNDFQLKPLTKGQDVKYNDFPADEMTVVQFWASWCKGCKENMRIIADYKNNKKKNFNFMAVSVDENFADAVKYFKNAPKNYSDLKNVAFHDQGAKLAESLEVDYLPALVIFDKNKKVIKIMKGKLDDANFTSFKKIVSK